MRDIDRTHPAHRVYVSIIDTGLHISDGVECSTGIEAHVFATYREADEHQREHQRVWMCCVWTRDAGQTALTFRPYPREPEVVEQCAFSVPACAAPGDVVDLETGRIFG